jgi:SPP1 gp7 family putative phage head morphogenesis protein
MNKKTKSPVHLERSMEEIYKFVILHLYKMVRTKLKRAYRDEIKVDAGFKETINEVLESAREFLKSEFLSYQIGRIEKQIGKWTQGQVDKMVDSLKEDPFKRDLGKLAVQYSLTDPDMILFSENFTKSNVELCQQLGNEYIEGVGAVAQETFFSGGSMGDLEKTMLEYTVGDVEKAKFWARDQVGDAYAKHSEIIQSKAGFDNYIWHTVGDNHVRGLNPKDQTSHVALNGRIFSWARGAESTGELSKPGAKHPGQDYNCRCWAEGTFEEVTN